MNHLRKITRIIANGLTIVLLIILGLVIYGKAITTFGNGVYPNYFGYTFFEVASGSMEPTLQINDVILVKITQEDLKKGDIVAFENEGTVITHRIIYMDGDILTVKGDNNDVVDKPITKGQVIGKITKIFPSLGIWKMVLTDPKILLAIFITLLLFDFALSYEGKPKLIKKAIKAKADITLVEEEKEEEKPLVTEVKPTEKEEKPREKVIEPESLLELTRKINIDEIKNLLEGTDYKITKKEINNIKKEISKVEEKIEQDEEVEELPKLSENERKVLEYTMRLDLNEIQKKINSKVR